jgi:Predicted Fe-S oxidoreductases
MNFYVHKSQMDKDSEYYELKMQNLEDAEKAFKNDSLITSLFPPRINIQSNYSCNAQCTICPIKRPLKGNKNMDISLFGKIAKELFPTTIVASTTTIGEPLLLPWFAYMLKIMDKHSVLADIVTNATLIDDEMINVILNVAADIKISYDGITEKTFNLMRPGCSKQTVEKTLQKFVKQRTILQPKQNPTITMQTTLIKSNIHELPEIVKYAGESGVDRIKAYYAISYNPEIDADVLAGDDSEYTSYIDHSREIAKSVGIEFEAAESSANLNEMYLKRVKCPTPWYQTWIDFDGTIRMCHAHSGYNIGNANKGIIECWNNDNYQKIRAASIENTEGSPCWNCGMLFSQIDDNTVAPYDRSNFISKYSTNRKEDGIKWSNRTRLFDTGRLQ